MAMTAWAAKFLTNSICLFVKDFTTRRVHTNTPIVTLSLDSGTPREVRQPPSLTFEKGIFRIGEHIRNMNDLAL